VSTNSTCLLHMQGRFFVELIRMGDALHNKLYQVDWTRWRNTMPTIITDFHRQSLSEKQSSSIWAKFFSRLKSQHNRRQSEEYLAQFDVAKLDDIGMCHTIRVVKKTES
jgi:uncharacterized protein YjiS (DUF1127 family)